MKQICLTIFMLMGLVASSQILVPFLKKNGKYIFVEKGSLKPVFKNEYDYALVMVKGLAAVRVNDKWGFVDSLGHEIAIKYDEIDLFSYGSALVKLEDQWGLIDNLGNELVEPQFERARKSRKGNIWVWSNNKCGLLDKLGKELIAPKFDDYDDYESFSSDGFGIVKFDGKWGYIDESGVEQIPFQYDEAQGFSDVLARVEMDGKCGYINQNGTAIIPIQYDGCLAFKEGFAAINANGKWGLVDIKGKLATPMKYERVMRFSGGLAAVKMNDKWGCVDKTGKEVIPLKYDSEFEFKEGLARVSLDNKDAYIDTKGNVVNQQFVLGDSFSEGLAAVAELRDSIFKWGYINKTGALVIKPKFDKVGYFKNGLAKVLMFNSGWGYIDKTGKEIVPIKFSHNGLGEFENGFALVGWEAGTSNVFFYVDTQGVQYREGNEYQKKE